MGLQASEELLERSAKEGTEEDILLSNEQLIPKWREHNTLRTPEEQENALPSPHKHWDLLRSEIPC